MATMLYALLVGINNYPLPVRQLRGCLNDVDRLESFLINRVEGKDVSLKQRVLRDAEATREAIIDGFREHLSQATKDDVVLFYFSGHGSQEASPEEFWPIEPDHLDETLVCYNSRLPGNYDLADKELAKLIAEVAVQKPHIIVILDCCHSGSGTRDGDDTGLRHEPMDKRPRPIESFLVSYLDTCNKQQKNLSDWISLPEGNHILMAACRAEEEAKEGYISGEQHGFFSHYLIEILQRSSNRLTYQDLLKQVNALVRARTDRQSPVIEANASEDLLRPFLGGAVMPRSFSYTLSFQPTAGWVIDGGEVHGISPSRGNETTILAIFPAGMIDDLPANLTNALADARVIEVSVNQSTVAIQSRNGVGLDPTFTYEAIVTALPIPKLEVYLTGDSEGIDQIRTMLRSNNLGSPSLYIEEGADATVGLQVVCLNGHYRILRSSDGRQLVVDTPSVTESPASYTEYNAGLVIDQLEHIARWIRLAELTNSPFHLSSDAVKMELIPVSELSVPNDPSDIITTPELAQAEIRLAYQYRNGRWEVPYFRVRLTNTTDKPLYCSLLGLSQRYGIKSLIPGGSERLLPGQIAWARGGKAIPATVPDIMWNSGITEVKDVLKLIVSTEPIDAQLLEQNHLEAPIDRSLVKMVTIEHLSTLNRLLRRVQLREYDEKPEQDSLPDWVTSTLSTTTFRPLD